MRLAIYVRFWRQNRWRFTVDFGGKIDIKGNCQTDFHFSRARMIDPRDTEGHIFLMTHKQPLDLSVNYRHLNGGSGVEEYLEYMKANILGRVFYVEGDGTFLTCFVGHNQHIDGPVFQQYRVEDLAALVKSNPNNVPSWLGDQSTMHWIQFVCSTREYHHYISMRMKGQKRQIIGVTLSPQPCPAPDACYLVAWAPPKYPATYLSIPDELTYEKYLQKVLRVCMPNTKVPAVKWFLSFLYWVRFDTDIPSFLTYLVMFIYGIHPQGWAPGKLFIVTGLQGTGKSEAISFFSRFINEINYTDPSIQTMTSNKFNVSLIKRLWVCQETGENWYKRLNNEFVRSLVTDAGGHEFEAKFGKQYRVMGSIMAVVNADRAGGPATSAEKQERRHVFMRFASEPKNVADYSDFKEAYRLFTSIMMEKNEMLNVFREEFRQALSDFFGPHFDYISSSGLQVPRVLSARDGFEDSMDEQTTATIKKTHIPAAKRAKTAVSPSAATAVNECARHLAMTGSVFPVADPAIFHYMFNNLGSCFQKADSIEHKHSFQRRLWNATWTMDHTPFEYTDLIDGTKAVFTDSLYSIYTEWKDSESQPGMLGVLEESTLRKTNVFYKMLAKFKVTLMARHLFAFGPESMMAWPKLLTPECALWILGVWMNYMTNGCTLRPDQAMWGDACSMQEYLLPSARMLLNRLTGRDNFSSGKHVEITNIQKTLKLDVSPYLGIGTCKYEVRPVQLYWGAFSILRNLVVLEGPTFRPNADEIAAILRMTGGEAVLVDRNKVDYDWLISCTPSHLMKQMAKIIEEKGIESQDEQSQIYYSLYEVMFSDGPLGLMKKTEFYESMKLIKVNVPANPRPANFRPRARLRDSLVDLGETTSDTITIAPVPSMLSTVEQRAREIQEARRQEQLAPTVSPIFVLSADEFVYPNVSPPGLQDTPTQSPACE